MSSTPPSLLYLTVYNPTLRPTAPVAEDDEDAEEQAQILFYTSGERAVSRDRMLRQVGLAKALVNFSSIFHDGVESSSQVHSQSRRMVMVSPEKDFWIHAGIEVAKSPKMLKSSEKKGKDKGKMPQQYDYHDASVHDIALRARLLNAYEQFKLTHGSFTSILENLGQQALELQLERFFTVWAWSWDLDEGHEFSEQFETPIHPAFDTVQPILDRVTEDLPEHISSLLVLQPYQVSSSRFKAARHPASLTKLLQSYLPPPVDIDGQRKDQVNVSSDDATIRTAIGNDPSSRPSQDNGTDSISSSSRTSSGTFLGMPSMNLDVNMKKWKWPGFSIGKTGKQPPPAIPLDKNSESKPLPEVPASADTNASEIDTPSNVRVNKSALDDAMFEDKMPPTVDSIISSPEFSPPSATESEKSAEGEEEVTFPIEDVVTPTASQVVSPQQPFTDAETAEASEVLSPADVSETSPSSSNTESSSSVPPESTSPPPEFLSRVIHLAPPDSPTSTVRQRVYFLKKNSMLAALVGLDEATADLSNLATKADEILSDIEKTLDDAEVQKKLQEPSPTAKSSRGKERHIVSAPRATQASSGFSSRSTHLFNAESYLTDSNIDIAEVFTRSQGTQQAWHVARSGLGSDPLTGNEHNGEVYLEVLRKEATLPDVDNALSGIIRRSAKA